MKYFEVHVPYYSLLKASSKEKAKEKYVEFVADDDGTLENEMEEVSRDYALVRFSRAPGEDRVLLPISDVIDEFVEEEHEVLIIDGSLL